MHDLYAISLFFFVSLCLSSIEIQGNVKSGLRRNIVNEDIAFVGLFSRAGFQMSL